jgi:hypothetical protein
MQSPPITFCPTDFIEADTSTTILFPAPSATDPNDPLRWPTYKKHIAFASICAFTFLTNFAIGGLAPAFYILSLEFDKSMTETSHLLTYPILVLGAFNFFWVPMANFFGKRPVFVFASGLLCACYVWGAAATSFESLLWSNIIAAFAGSSTEALGAAIVNVSTSYLMLNGCRFGLDGVRPLLLTWSLECQTKNRIPKLWMTETSLGSVLPARARGEDGDLHVRIAIQVSPSC